MGPALNIISPCALSLHLSLSRQRRKEPWGWVTFSPLFSSLQNHRQRQRLPGDERFCLLCDCCGFRQILLWWGNAQARWRGRERKERDEEGEQLPDQSKYMNLCKCFHQGYFMSWWPMWPVIGFWWLLVRTTTSSVGSGNRDALLPVGVLWWSLLKWWWFFFFVKRYYRER